MNYPLEDVHTAKFDKHDMMKYDIFIISAACFIETSRINDISHFLDDR